MKIVNIYVLKCPESLDVRYVGQTTNIKVRYRDHLKGNKYRNTYTTNWIQSLLNKNLKPVIEIIDNCSIEDLDKTEQYYIKKYKEQNCNLTNHSIGGKSSFGCKHSLESRLKRSQKQKGRKINMSEEVIFKKRKMAAQYLVENPDKRIDNLLSKEERYIAALKGNKIASQKAKKVVLKLAKLNNEIIEEYESVIEAANKNNINKTTLAAYCRNLYNQPFKDFYFVYKIATQKAKLDREMAEKKLQIERIKARSKPKK